jgi:hypothetical protein
MAEFRDYGFRGGIVKPYDLAELGEALRSVLTEGKKAASFAGPAGS